MIALLPYGRRRRTYLSLFVAILLAGTMFMAFQMFTYDVLSSENEALDRKQRREYEILRSKRDHHMKRNDKGQDDPCIKEPNLCSKGKFKENESYARYRKQHLSKWGDQLREQKPKQGDQLQEQKPKQRNQLPGDKDSNKELMRNERLKGAQGNSRGKPAPGIPKDKVHPEHLLGRLPPENPSYNLHVGEIPRGVPPRLAQLYIPNQNGNFQCHNKQKEIPMSFVNDDYCDCPDSSDEPGTNACPDSKLYCAFQLSDTDLVFFPSSRVNDGICDCCDGSDEWDSHPLPESVRLPDRGASVKVYQVPCQDQCQDLRREKENRATVQRQGALLKRKYIERAQGKDNPNQMYGVDSAFQPLSTDCYSLTSGKYEYKVCPFREVTQLSGSDSTLLGDQPSWISQDNGANKLLMKRGLARGCPGGIERSSVINFECGVEDKLLHAREDEVCKYLFVMSSPAAC